MAVIANEPPPDKKGILLFVPENKVLDNKI